MALFVDSRERNILLQLETIMDDDFIIKPLDVGDFMIVCEGHSGNVIFERKTVQDLLASLKDNRYREQKMRMLQLRQNGCKIVYIIEGTPDFSDEHQLGCFMSMQIRDQIPMVFTKDMHDTITYLQGARKRLRGNPEKYLEFHKITNDDYTNVTSICTRKKGNVTKQSVFINQLCAIPGISAIKARAISVSTKATCMHDLIPMLGSMKVAGVGSKLQKSLTEFLT